MSISQQKFCLFPMMQSIYASITSKNLRGGGTQYKEKIGCIEIGDNVFIGSNTTVLYNVKIGSNVIIGAGSLVNKDIPDNSVAVGTPARVIGSFDDFVEKRRVAEMYPDKFTPHGHNMSEALEEWCWDNR